MTPLGLSDMLNFEKVEQGIRWPSGDYRDVAVLPISDSEVQAVFGELTEGTSLGLACGWPLASSSPTNRLWN